MKSKNVSVIITNDNMNLYNKNISSIFTTSNRESKSTNVSQMSVVKTQSIEEENSNSQSEKNKNEKDKILEAQLESEYLKEVARKREQQIEFENKFKNTNIRKSRDEKIICLATDGFETTSYAFNIIIKEFITKLNASFICSYIYNSIHNEEYNWRQQKEFIIDDYNTRLLSKLTEEKGHLVIQDFDPNCSHPIEQVYKIAVKNKCNFLFLGFNGLKTATYKSINISRGMDFLLRESIMPTVIIKEKNLRGEKNEGYKWLIVMDRASSDCFQVFDFFYPLMDVKRDFIYGLTLLPRYVKFDDIKEPFDMKMNEIGINKEKKVFYEAVNYSGRFDEAVKNMVNKNNEHFFDFVVFYNNPDKYKVEKDYSQSFKLVMNLKANICFVNVVYIKRLELQEMEDKRKKNEQED